MDVNFVATRVQWWVQSEISRIESEYEGFPESAIYVAMIDLVASSDFRATRGPKKGYIRGREFFSVVEGVLRDTFGCQLIKELGDAVMIKAGVLREVLEPILLVDLVINGLQSLEKDETYPLSVRAGIGFGECKRIRTGPPEDYLGSAIDELARIMQVRSTSSTVLVSQRAYETGGGVISEYGGLSLSDVKEVPAQIAKSSKTIYYRELIVDRKRLGEERANFAPWRAKIDSPR